MQSQRNDSGFTLLELIVGAAISSIIAYSAFSLYLTMHKEMLVQEIVTDTQANARAATESLSHIISVAGYDIPRCLAPIETHNSNPDTIVVDFNSGTPKQALLTISTPFVTSELDCSGYDIAGLNPGDWAYIYNPEANSGEFFLVSSVDTTLSIIGHASMPLSAEYPSGSTVSKINRVKFYVDRTDTTQSKLMIQNLGSQPQIFADNISDLNFRYFLSNGSIVLQTSNPDDIRMVEIEVVGKNHRQDIIPSGCTRSFSLRVKIRNIDLYL